jgi:hypothetical protein
MSKLEQIETDILALSAKDFEALKQWCADLDYEQWDRQIEQDIANGRLDAFAQEALAEFQAGHCQTI